MDEQYPTYASYDPVNTPIMDPERQLEAPEFGAAAIAPLAMLGLGLAGVVAYALRRRRKPSLQERVLSMLEDRAEDVRDFAHDEVEPRAEDARKKGFKLFKRGSKAAGEALHTASDVARDAAQSAAHNAAAAGAELLKQGGKAASHLKTDAHKAADQAYAQAKHFRKHEGRDLEKQARKASKEAAKTAQMGRKNVVHAYQAFESKYPILTGLMVAALMSEGQKLFESYRTRKA